MKFLIVVFVCLLTAGCSSSMFAERKRQQIENHVDGVFEERVKSSFIKYVRQYRKRCIVPTQTVYSVLKAENRNDETSKTSQLSSATRETLNSIYNSINDLKDSYPSQPDSANFFSSKEDINRLISASDECLEHGLAYFKNLENDLYKPQSEQTGDQVGLAYLEFNNYKNDFLRFSYTLELKEFLNTENAAAYMPIHYTSFMAAVHDTVYVFNKAYPTLSTTEIEKRIRISELSLDRIEKGYKTATQDFEYYETSVAEHLKEAPDGKKRPQLLEDIKLRSAEMSESINTFYPQLILAINQLKEEDFSSQEFATALATLDQSLVSHEFISDEIREEMDRILFESFVSYLENEINS